MSDALSSYNPARSADLNTRLTHDGRAGSRAYGFVNPPLSRGSTVLFPSTEERSALQARKLEQVVVYGTAGNETHHALENLIANIEGGNRAQIVSTGLAAVTTALLAYLKNGDHLLLPDSVYGPARNFAQQALANFGIETTVYPPTLSPSQLKELIQPNTRVLYTESPGSHTFEVQDIRALANVAHEHGIKVIMDNTWGIHHFQPFAHGVDVSIQALTKYAGGHSDVLLGSITTDSDEDWQRIRKTSLLFGQYASPDDCWLALRGMRTLGVRLKHQADSALQIAHWLQGRNEVSRVLYPALPGAPGHELWVRDFSGAASLFGVVLSSDFTVADSQRFVDSLRLFGIGASWGGYESLAIATTPAINRDFSGDKEGALLRLHIGLESPEELIADLEQGFSIIKHKKHTPR